MLLHIDFSIASRLCLSTPKNTATIRATKLMKKDIHPQYYPKSKVTCACGNKFTVGATRAEIKVEICSKCHPFYTGSQQLIDTAGRVEKFKARRVKAQAKGKIGSGVLGSRKKKSKA